MKRRGLIALAAEMNSVDVIDWLIEQGADVNEPIKGCSFFTHEESGTALTWRAQRTSAWTLSKHSCGMVLKNGQRATMMEALRL